MPTSTHYRTCNLCEASCGLVIEHEGGAIRSIRGDVADPLSRGHVCPKAVALQDLQADPDRLRHPVRRVGRKWERVSWEEALDESAQRLGQVRQSHGRDSIGVYLGNPVVHNYGASLFLPLLLGALRTRNRFSATSADQLPHQLIAYLMYGHQLLLPVPDLDRTQFWLILGANPAVSNGSLMTAPDVVRRLKAIRDRGGRVVVVDPRRTETARLADEHLFIRPGTDVLLLLAMVRAVLADRGGWEPLPGLVEPYSAERVAPVVGISGPKIVELARQFAAAPSAVAYGRLGASTQSFGALTQWLIQLLNLTTGNLDRPGGAMFTNPAFDPLTFPDRGRFRGHFAKRRSRVRGLPEFAGEFPVATLAEEILTPGAGQIRAMVTAAGNPALSVPNGRQLQSALASLDFMLSIDMYVNETTRHAHLILPPHGPLERDHYDIIFNVLAIRNTARYSSPLVEPGGGALAEWQIYLELARRLGHQGPASRIWRALLGWLGPRGILALGLRFGPYGQGWNPFGPGLTLSRLERAPHGLDLGPLRPCLPGRLATPDGRIRVAPEAVVADLPRVESLLTGGHKGGELLLVGRRQLRSNNSWMHNCLRLVKGKPGCTLLMSPQDAAGRGLSQGQQVTVRSRVGKVEIPLEISHDMMEGVVSIPHGWGHQPAAGGQELGQTTAWQHPGVSLNDLTDDRQVDELSGNAAFSGVLVTVENATAK